MIDDPVEKASSSSAQPNSRDAQRHDLLAQPRQVHADHRARRTGTRRRSRGRTTASIEFGDGVGEAELGGDGAAGPAAATTRPGRPAPSGETAARRSQSRSRSTSRASACTCLASSCPNDTGWACCRCVKPGRRRVDDARSAWSSSAFCELGDQPAGERRAWSRRYSRRSVATWSLRLRPARSLPPSGAEPLEQPALERGVHVLVGAVGRNAPATHVGREVVQRPRASGRARRRSSSPARCSTRGVRPRGRRGRTAPAASRSGRDRTARPAVRPDRPANRPPHSRVGCAGSHVARRSASSRPSPTRAQPVVAGRRRSCWAGPTAR